MYNDFINPNFPGLDTGVSLGQRVSVRTSRFAFDLAAGATIAPLVDPFGAGSTFETAGVVPPQLALSGSAIVKGAAAAVAGTSYWIWIVAISPEGIRRPAERLTFRAQLPLGGVPIVVPAPTPSPTPSPTPTPTPTPSTLLLDGVTQAPVMRFAGMRTASGQTGPIASVAVGTGNPFDVASAAEALAAGATKVVSLYSGGDALTFATRLDLVVEDNRIVPTNNTSSAVQAPIPSSILSAMAGATGLHGSIAVDGIRAGTSGDERVFFLSSDTTTTVPIFLLSRNNSQRMQAAFRRLNGDSATLVEAGGVPGVTMPGFEIFDAGIDYNTGGTRNISVGRFGTDSRGTAAANTDANALPSALLSGYISVPAGGKLLHAMLFKGKPTYADEVQVRKNAKANYRVRYLKQNDGGFTWWTNNVAVHPDKQTAWGGTTNGEGMFVLNEWDVQTRGLSDVEALEPRQFTVDEHQSVAVAFTPNGRGLLALGGHSNLAPNTPQEAIGRVRLMTSPDGKLKSLKRPPPFGNGVAGVDYFDYFLSNVSTTAGTNYGDIDVIDNNNFIVVVNNDNRADWRGIRFTDGNIANGVKLRPFLGGTIQTGGQGQTYMLRGVLSPTTRRLFVQFHPSNVRNIIYGIDFNVATGDVYSGSTTYGNAYAGNDTQSPIVDFANASLVLPKVVYDPGAGNSFRLMDAYGDTIAGVVFVASDGSNARHIEVLGDGTVNDLGPAGAYFGTVFPGPYFCDIKRAREPHSGRRYYRSFNDGNKDGAYTRERIDIATNGTITRTVLETAPAGTDKLLRSSVAEGATDTFAGINSRGAYGGFNSWRYRAQPFGVNGL